MLRTIGGAFAVLLILSAGGCATVPMAAAVDDARMKGYAPSGDSALIYVYRNETIGFGVHMEVDLDGRQYGATVAKTYMVWEVPSGPHVLISHAENDSTLAIDAEPGRRYYVWQEVKMGVLFARSRLQRVTDPMGATGVGECHLVAMPLPRARPIAPPPPPSPPTSARPSS